MFRAHLRRIAEFVAFFASIASFAVAAPPRAFATVPTGFVDEIVQGGFVVPVATAFDGAGRMFVVEKRGVVRVISNGTLLPTPLIDLSAEVHDAHDKGLLGFALDPAFLTNGRFYLLYNVDPIFGPPDENGDSITFGRVVRYTSVGNVADLSSRLVLLGNSAADGIANCHSSHAVGTLAFGTDGTLFVGSGDGAHWDFADGGEDVTSFDPGCAAAFGTSQDVGALRSQDFDALSGKILRLDPTSGLGLATNPFYDGNTSSFASRVWAIGLRNPFRFTVRPGSPAPGTLYIGDVGWTDWEELNVSRMGGENFGWPCWEGSFAQGSYQSHPITGATCQGLEASEVTMPLIAWNHGNPGSIGFTGNTSSGACFYTGTQFPVQYRGRCFFADYGQGWIRIAEVNGSDQLVSLAPFASNLGAPVDVKNDPQTGDLVYVSITEGRVRRIRWAGGNVAPVAEASANPSAGPAPLVVQFSSNGTFDPNDDAITLSWNFGDGAPTSSEANPLHTYTALGTFVARLVATDEFGLADSAEVVVETINEPPTVTIENPSHASTFQSNETILLSADASDHEDGSDLDYAWNVQLIHNEHLHPGWFASNQANPLFLATGHGGSGDRYSYMIICTVTDSGGLFAADTSVVLPANLGVNQAPLAAIDATPSSGPSPLVVGLSAVDSVDPDGDYLFYSWDFGDGTHGAGATTTHIYGAPGLYTMTLTVTDPVLATDVASASVFVEPSGELAKWKLDEGSGGAANDASGSGRHATLAGGPAWVAGVFGGALDFDGVNDAAASATSFLSNRSAFSLCAWIRPGSTGNRVGLLGQNDAIEFGFISAGSLQIWTPGGGSLTTPYPFPMNSWHHVAATGDGSALRVYFDGVQAATAPNVTANYGSSSFPVRFGGGGIFDASGNFFDGSMDDVRVYGVALSPASIALLGAAPPPNSAPLVDAGEDFSAGVAVPAPLLAEVSDDGLPSPPGATTILWTQVSGPAVSTIAEPGNVFTHVTCPAVGTYVFRATANDAVLLSFDEVSVTVVVPTGSESLALVDGLRGVGPNPARERSIVTFGIARDGTPVKLLVHDVSGRRVATLRDGILPAGEHRALWNGQDDDGRRAGAGIYFVVLEAGGVRSTRKIALLR